MKKIFLTGFLLLIFVTHGIAQSEWMKTVIDNIPVTAPPSSDITKQRRAAYNVPGEDRGFPDYTYKDFQRNQRIIKIRIGKRIVLHIVNFANRGIPNLRFWGLVSTKGITGTYFWRPMNSTVLRLIGSMWRLNSAISN